MLRGRVIAVVGIGAAVACAPAAEATPGTTYGGAAFDDGKLSGPTISLVHRADGSLVGRVGTSISCGRKPFINVAIRVTAPPTGDAFTATGDTLLLERARVVATVSGTLTPAGAEGTVAFSFTGRLADCVVEPLPFSLRAASAPAAGPAPPPPAALRFGLTRQATGGVLLPVALKVSASGRRVRGAWQATMRCGPRARWPVTNYSPPARIRDDAFVQRERFTIRYGNGERHRWRVVFRGRFTADGAVGSLRARMRIRRRGHTYFPCDSGTRRWTATG